MNRALLFWLSPWSIVCMLLQTLCVLCSAKNWFSQNCEMLVHDEVIISFDYLVPYHFMYIKDSCEVFITSEPRLGELLHNVTTIRSLPGFVLRGRDLHQMDIKEGFVFIKCKFVNDLATSFENNFGVFFRLKDFHDIHLQQMNWDMQTYNISDWELLPLQKFDPFQELEIG